MLKNFWYVVAATDELSTKPKKVKLLGQDLVLFKDAEGHIACLSDICIHRGASLAGGKVKGSCIECPYHGWLFKKNGTLAKIPSQAENIKIPQRAKIDSYPVASKYGWLWVFMGDLAESERPPIPEFPEFANKEWRCVRGEYIWQAHYARVIENGLDFSHAPFVHPTFGDPSRAEIEDYKVQLHEWGASASASYIPPMYRGLWKLIRKKPSPVKASPSFHMCGGLMRLNIQITSTWKQIIYDVNTPIDDKTTHTRWIHARNFMKSPLADADARKRVHNIFLQDANIVENIKPIQTPLDLSAELSVKSDGLQMAYRKMRRDFKRKGWGVDMNDSHKEKHVHVIPSPERMKPQNSDINWVIPEFPSRRSIESSNEMH